MAATAVSGLGGARRSLREQVLTDAGPAGIPATYTCAVYVGWPEVRAVAEVIRRVRPTMVAEHNPFHQLEYLLSEAASLSTDDDPPVLLIGLVTVTRNPRS